MPKTESWDTKLKSLKAQFTKSYDNLLADERSLVIVIIEDRPYSWNRAFDEIKAETELGKKILLRLKELGIL